MEQMLWRKKEKVPYYSKYKIKISNRFVFFGG